MRTILASLLCAFPAVAQEVPVRRPNTEEVVKGKVGRVLDDYLTRCAAFGFSGCALVEWKGDLVLRKGYGQADPATGAPNTPETLYDIASASKQVTAAAILKLVEQDKLALDDSARDYLPELPEADAGVTIEHLLRHTSGYPRSGPSGGGSDLAGAIAGYTSRGRRHEPGAHHDYWNGGYALLAGIVERVSEAPFEEYCRSHLFAPAGLAHTDFIETLDVDESHLAFSHEDGGRRTDEYIKGWGYRGMGGVLTSISDLQLWVDAVLTTERVLSLESRALMLTPGLGKYALGWYVLETERDTRCVQHGGTSPGFQTYIRAFPDEKALTLVVCNREGMHWQVAWGLEALLWDQAPKVPFPPEIMALSKKAQAALPGSWESPEGDRLDIVLDGNGISVLPQSPKALVALTGGTDEDLGWEIETARAIMEEIAAGKSDLLAEVMQERIPSSWPATMNRSIWPRHVGQWGSLESIRDLGAIKSRGGVQVFLGLTHANGERTVKIIFNQRRLGILDLEANRSALKRGYALTSRSLFESYSFSTETLPSIEWNERKKTLTVGGLEFRRP